MTLALAACSSDGSGGSGSSGSTKGSGGATSTTLDLSKRVTVFPVPSRNHTQEHVNYPQKPPVGGDHFSVWQNCGFYSEPVMNELGVHSMEHGAVWITFRPNLPKDQVDVLHKLAGTSKYVLVSPWADNTLPAPVVASAWGLQLKADSASDPAVAAFVKTYAAGPQTPEVGGPCSGGFGTPE